MRVLGISYLDLPSEAKPTNGNESLKYPIGIVVLVNEEVQSRMVGVVISINKQTYLRKNDSF